MSRALQKRGVGESGKFIIFFLAIRNIGLSLNRRFFLMMVIGLTLALMLVGNTIFQGTENGIEKTFRDSFTGDFSISSESETPFTVFGNELPLVGEYEVLPTLVDQQAVDSIVLKHNSVSGIAHQVSASGLLQIGKLQVATLFFGVDFEEYLHFFPGIQLIKGAAPRKGDHAILLNQTACANIESQLKRSLMLGDPIQLVSQNSGGFTIREVKFAGTFVYPVADDVLNRIGLIDADTARSLDGYIYGASRMVETQGDTTRLLEPSKSIDDLFGVSSDQKSDQTAPISLSSIETVLRGSSEQSNSAASTDGSWNFTFGRIKPGINQEDVIKQLRSLLGHTTAPVQVRDWRETAGGNAQLVYFVRILFNIGMLLVALISIFVMTNSLSLSVYERTKEIGTMRALGASKGFVARLFALETLLLVVGAGLLGLLLGVMVLLFLSVVGIPLNNSLLAALFGSKMIRPQVLWDQIAIHLLIATLMGGGALLLPLRVALRISPGNAMAKEA